MIAKKMRIPEEAYWKLAEAIRPLILWGPTEYE